MFNHDKVISRVHSVHLMNVEQRQVAADSQTKSTDFGCESTSRLLLSTPTIAISVLFGPKDDTNFTVPQTKKPESTYRTSYFCLGSNITTSQVRMLCVFWKVLLRQPPCQWQGWTKPPGHNPL